ncbi:MAG: sigma-54-dependent Fis family transcriptional regulator [SAR324 cluster bacterium]|nr:sigma-54-dependent Fis family transcriptional regulator [SAR324 cluster bacterium]
MPPGIDGLETAKRLRKIDPNLQIVIATAFADYPFYEIAKQLGKREALFYLEKPFTADQVRQLAHSLVQQWATRHELEVTLEQFMRLAEQRFKDHNARGEVGAGLRETLLMVEDLTGTKSLALARQTPRGGFEHVAGTGLLENQRDLDRARQKRIALALFEIEGGEGEEVPPGPRGTGSVWAVVMMEPTQSRELCLAAVKTLRPYLPHAAEQLASRAGNADAGTPLTTAAAPEEAALASVGSAEAQSATDPLTDFHGILTGDPAMLVLFEQIRRVARQDVPVFITGETGSGKEMAAKALHSEGRRSGKPFVALNCANLTEPLLESQLFGHRKGAFTGATADQRGLLAEAEGGILFLDEVTEIPLALQAKLLRVLQEREYTPLGSTRPISFDILIVSAAQTPLREAVEAGRFRPDLQYRLHVIPLVLPPLRARSDDRVLLFDRFLRSAFKAQRGETPIPRVSPEVWQVIRHYQWPGNVRELQNVCAYVVAMTSGPEITVEFLPEDLRMSLLSQIQEGLGGGVAPAAAAQLETETEHFDRARKHLEDFADGKWVVKILTAFDQINEGARLAAREALKFSTLELAPEPVFATARRGAQARHRLGAFREISQRIAIGGVGGRSQQKVFDPQLQTTNAELKKITALMKRPSQGAFTIP